MYEEQRLNGFKMFHFPCIGHLYEILQGTNKYTWIYECKSVTYKIRIEFGIPSKLVRLIKMSLTETYSRFRVGKNVSDKFPIGNGLKQGDALSPMLFNFPLEYSIRKVQVNQDGLKLNIHINFWVRSMVLIYWEKAYIL